MISLKGPGETWVFGSLLMYKDKMPKKWHLLQDPSVE